tara:strand:- start:530 stop:1597 length:1068 start_codon:yes stop_codon:yes gene_type:complete
MADASVLQTQETPDLRSRWLALKEAEPTARAKDAARKLGVTEAELVACRCGDGVRRLHGPWGDLLQDLPSLGEVMTLTRNEHVVHEKHGTFGNVSVARSMGLVLNGEIDLRVMLSQWGSGFAVTEELSSGLRHSLQFFGPDGTAIHKIYVPKDDNATAYEDLVGKYIADDQGPDLSVVPRPAPRAEKPDSEIRVEEMRDAWRALDDVHDFMIMLRKYKVSRTQAMRLVGDDLAWRVEPESFVRALEEAASSGLSIMIFVGSPGVIQIHTGRVEKLRRVSEWFNVLDPRFNLHLKDGDIASAWVVRKPTRDGIVTSLEIFNRDNEQIALMFGERHEGDPENTVWRDLAESLEKLTP